MQHLSTQNTFSSHAIPCWTWLSPTGSFTCSVECINETIYHVFFKGKFQPSFTVEFFNQLPIFFQQVQNQNKPYQLLVDLSNITGNYPIERSTLFKISSSFLAKADTIVCYQVSPYLKNLLQLLPQFDSAIKSIHFVESFEQAISKMGQQSQDTFHYDQEITFECDKVKVLQQIASMIWTADIDTLDIVIPETQNSSDISFLLLMLQKELQMIRLGYPQSREQLQKIHQSLENQVQQRTFELTNEIQQRKELEKTLRQSELRYRAVAEAIADYACSVIFNKDGSTYWEWESVPYPDITGYTHEEIRQMGGTMAIIHPDDHHVIAIRKEMNKLGKADVNEYRIITKSGETRWLRDYTLPVWNEENTRVDRIYGATQDVTDRKIIEENARESLHMAEFLRSAALAMTSSLNLQHVLDQLLKQTQSLVSSAYIEILWLEDNKISIIRHSLTNAVSAVAFLPTPIEAYPCLIEVIQSGKTYHEPFLSAETRIPTLFPNNKEQTWLCAPLRTGEKLFGFISLFRSQQSPFNDQQVRHLDIFANQAGLALENAILFAEVNRIAQLDPLTETYNRWYFFQVAEKEFQTSKNKLTPLAAIMFDLDKFKQINDLYGHRAGDHALRFMTQIYFSNLRTKDIFCRYGGDEFIILLPNTQKTKAISIAQRLQKSLRERPLLWQGQEIPLSISVGVAINYPRITTLDQLLDEADQGLYRSKRQGGNQIYCMEE
ncbi:MAG: hypothetical protein CVU39_20665 [Chloroflexi bacterium HGW-Chloroflexi-10]|nr:MAG: hypothetical protein CVU39_20665 [Chloroflexi bacterium HGW-Chloroflexi-10]